LRRDHHRVSPPYWQVRERRRLRILEERHESEIHVELLVAVEERRARSAGENRLDPLRSALMEPDHVSADGAGRLSAGRTTPKRASSPQPTPASSSSASTGQSDWIEPVERFPIEWSHSIDQKSLQIQRLEHILVDQIEPI
jgi:hypothetical protein